MSLITYCWRAGIFLGNVLGDLRSVELHARVDFSGGKLPAIRSEAHPSSCEVGPWNFPGECHAGPHVAAWGGQFQPSS